MNRRNSLVQPGSRIPRARLGGSIRRSFLSAALLGIAAPAVVHGSVAAQTVEQSQQAPLPLPRLAGEIRLDGRVDEPAWDAIDPLSITQKVPVEGAPPSQPTEIRITYDTRFLYLSGRLYDREPDQIVANTKRRDDFTENTEWVGLLIDTYDDRENALGFFVTPTGARLDMAISNDAQGPTGGISTDWNAFWEAEVTRDERGWFAEIRIPLSSLPFDAPDGTAVMGITTWRYIARTDETAVYPPRGLSTGSSFRPSLTQRFVLAGLEPDRRLSITPYTLAGRAESHVLAPAGDRYVADAQFQREAGLDARTSLGSNVTIDLTLNTDFAQVEVDDQQVNLGRSALFFPEKRMFFQERASLFDFQLGDTDRLFHSRRIGIVDGSPTRIYGGVRAVAKSGEWEGGLLSMQTRAQAATPSENFTVLRLKRRVLNEQSTVGLIATRRAEWGGDTNTVYGVDGTLRIAAEKFLALRWAQSFGAGLADGSALERARLFVELANRSPRGFTYSGSVGRVGGRFAPGVGFQARNDVTDARVRLAYNAFPSAESRFVQYGPYADGATVWGNGGRGLESRGVQAGLRTFTKSGWSSDAYLRHDREVLAGDLPLGGGILVPAGAYAFRTVGGSLTTPSSLFAAGWVAASHGGFFGGRRTSLTVAPILTLTPDLSVTATGSWNRISPTAGSDDVTVRLLSVRTDYFFSTRLSASFLFQHSSVERRFLGSFRLRYNPSEGNDLYVVFNGDANQSRHEAVPPLPRSNQSTLQVKYSYTFRP